MKRKKPKPVFMRQCDWCGDDIKTNHPNSDPYVINLEHKIFCKIHKPGEEPFKDCLEDYTKDRRKNVQEKKQKKQERLLTQKKVSVQEKEKVINKFDNFLAELNRRRNEKRLS